MKRHTWNSYLTFRIANYSVIVYLEFNYEFASFNFALNKTKTFLIKGVVQSDLDNKIFDLKDYFSLEFLKSTYPLGQRFLHQ